MVVEGTDDQIVRLRMARIVWDERNNITGRRIMVIELPRFPVEELIGRRLLSGSLAEIPGTSEL